MSRLALILSTWRRGFPRVSGDEPAGWERLEFAAQFSPRERG